MLEQPQWYPQQAYPPPYRYPYRAYPFYPPMQPPPYWMGKRQQPRSYNREADPKKREYLSDHDYYDSLEQETINRQLLKAIGKQNNLLEKTYNKLNEFLNKDRKTTTEDWNYIEPYLKEDTDHNNHKHKDVSRKDLDYYGDDQ